MTCEDPTMSWMLPRKNYSYCCVASLLTTRRFMLASSDVSKVGVTRCGNWWCHFFTSKGDDLFLSHCPDTRTLSAFPGDRLSCVLLNSAAKKLFSLGCQSCMARLSLVTPLRARFD